MPVDEPVWGKGLEPLVEYQQEFLQQMAERTAHVADFSEGVDFSGAYITPETMTAARIALQNATERVDREVDRQIEARVRGGEAQTRGTLANMLLSTYRDLNAAPLANGEPLTPGTCHNCGATGPVVPRPCTTRECHSQACIDLCVECVGGSANSYARLPRGVRPEFVVADDVDYPAPVDTILAHANRPSNQTATGALMAQHLEEASRRLNQVAYGDLYGFTPTEGSLRPDHYRVRPGECSCGFISIFTGDMQAHLASTAI